MNVDTGEMVRYPVKPVPGVYEYIPYDWDILATFFQNHDIVPVWINCHYTWGSYDKELGKWTGAVGKVRHSAFGSYISSYSKFIHSYYHFYWNAGHRDRGSGQGEEKQTHYW